MKKIKITEQQAKMLKELNKRKVVKVTKEQYSKIVEFQNINETDSITKQFNNSLSREARKEFNKTKLPGIKEMYEEFINELYSVNEGCEKKYETLTKLMEMAGMVRNNKIVKEKFYNDKMVVEYAICEGLYEINNGGSPYRAMERIEEALSDEEIMQNIRKNINKIPVSSTNPTPPEKLEKELGFLRNRELNRREKESSDFKSLFDNIDEDAGDYPMGADMDSRAPFNEPETLKTTPKIVKNKKYSELYTNDEISILKDEFNNKYLFNYDHIGKSEFFDYIELPYTTSKGEDGLADYEYDYENFIIDGDVIENYVNDNLNTLSLGKGVEGMEDNNDLVLIDEELKNQIIKFWSNDDNILKYLSMDETTVAGASSQGGSSGPYVGNLGVEKKNELSNVSDELNDLITDEFEVNSNDDFILKKVIDQLSEIIKTPSVTPEIIEKESYKLLKIISLLDNVEFNDETKEKIYGYYLPHVIKQLVGLSKIIYSPEYSGSYDLTTVFNKYIKQIELTYNTLKELKGNLYNFPTNSIKIFEQGIGSVGAYDTNPFNDANLGSGNEKGKGPTHKKTMIPGGKFVKIKDECNEFPYCNQGADAIEN